MIDLDVELSSADHSPEDDEDVKSLDQKLSFGFEFLDHIADVQIHAWAPTLQHTFALAGEAMFSYMTDISTVRECQTHSIIVDADDKENLLYRFLNEWLGVFGVEDYFLAKRIQVTEYLQEIDDNGQSIYKIGATGWGECMQLGRHPQGTEVKAITYSNMQIHDNGNQCDVFVIIDI